jgi:hypothetical protein
MHSVPFVPRNIPALGQRGEQQAGKVLAHAVPGGLQDRWGVIEIFLVQCSRLSVQ